MALLPQFSYNSLDSEEEKKKKKNVKSLLKATNNEGSKEKIEDAKNNYNYSAKINKYLESNYRTKAAQNNIVLPSKRSSSSSLKSLQPNNFTILENDKKSNLKPSNTIVDIDTLKNKQNFNNKSNPLSLDITPKLQAGVENVKKYNDYIKRADVRSDLLDLKDSRNELALDRYNLDLEKVNNKNINLYDKTLGRFVRGAKSMLLNTDTKYTRDDGVEVSLPTYNDLLEQKTAENYNTGVGKFLGEATSNIGRIVTSSVINRVLPGAGTVTYFGDMFMDQYNNNLLEGYDESSSLMNASIGTISEVLTEKLLGGISKQIFGGNSSELSEQVAKGISKLTKNKKIVSVFSNASSEAIEEFLQTYTEKLNDQITLEKDFDIKELFSKDTLSEAIYSAGIGAVSGGVLSSFSGVDPNISDIVDKQYNNNLNNETNTLIDSNEYNNIKKYVAEPSENDKITNFRNSVQNSDAIDNEKTTYVMNTIEKVINDKNYNIIFDSSIINKNGRSVDGLITTNSNNEVEIKLNPLSNRSVEFLLTHEITHSIETTELKNLVLNFASKNSKFNESLKSLQETYGTTDVSSEVLADISGQLLGNEEFINNLKIENTPKSKNIIKTIYESIKRLLNNLTEKGRYRNFIKDLESKWADAYKTVTTEQSIENLKNDEKFSIQTDINGNKYVNVDTNQNIFEGKTLAEQTKIAKEYILNNFKGKELSINDNSVMVTRKTANEYTHPKTTLQKKGTSSKMKASTELDNLLSISEYKYSKADDGRHKFAKDGWDYYETTFKVGNIMYNGLINIAKNGNKKMLYDITNLKRNTQISSPVNTATESIGIPLTVDNIPQSNNNVNSDTSSTKYSMQEVDNNTSDTSNSLKKEIILKSKENLKNDKSVKFKDLNEILELQDSEGGYREYNNDELISSIKKEGFKKPINLMIDSKGNISIENGNHRLEVAKKLGLDEVPVKFVESYAFDNSDVIWYNKNENFDYIKKFQEDYLNGINRTTKNVNRFYEELRNINGSNSISNELDGNSRGTKRIVHMVDGESGLGKRSQFETTGSRNDLGKKKSQKRSREELGNSSFSLDKKYSMQEDTSNSWQKHLEENYPTRGTTTKFSEFILPKYKKEVSASKIKQSGVLPKGSDVLKNDNLSFNSDEYLTDDASKNIKNNSTELKQKNIQKIENNKQTISKLESSRNKTLKSIDLEIKEKRKLYDSKKKKNTKIANVIQQQIITLEARKKSITEAYKQRIDRLEDRNKKLSSQDNYTNIQRKSKNIEYKELAESIIIDNINTWKDKSMGIEYKLEKMERIFYDVIPDRKVAKQMVDTYIVPLKIAESNQKHFINEYVNRIKEFNLTNEEAVAVQLLGEAKFNTSSLNNNIKRAKKTLLSTKADQEVKNNAQFYLNVLDYIEKNNLNIDRIQYHVNEFKKIYNELFLKINKVLKEQGYKEMDYMKDYFPHFVEEHAKTKVGKLMEKLGWKSYNNKIPTDIAGKTDTFKPGRTYFGHLKHRTGNYTEYNALKGFDNYIVGASNLIFLTEPIQKLRALENEIRYLHSEKGVQQKYNEILTSDLDTDTKDVQIAQLFADAKNPLNNFVTELRSYTDGIANKKSELDRRLEQAFNRGIYGTMTNIQNRASANMVGMNISSALTNFIPITQAYSQVSAKNMLKAIKSTLANSITSDGFVENSEFLSNRLIKSEKLYMTNLEKISEKANVMFDAVDSFTSNVVTRAKYYENIEKGMKPIEALKDADTYANNVIAGRDKASLPTIFNSKNFIVKLFSSFQLEVNNQYRYMLKDLPSDLKDEALSKLIGAYVKMFFGAWLYNFFAEKITGRKSAFSPADIVLDSIKTIQNDNGSAFDKSVSILKDVAGEVPFLGNVLGGGRLPISSALPNLSNSAEALSTIFDKDAKDSTKKTAKNNLKKEILKPLYYVVPPFGGGQLKKTIEGASIHLKDVPGSYTSSGKLRFTAEKGILPTAKDLLFGQYSSKNAREYFENDYEPLTLKQQEEFLELDVDLTTYRKYYADFKEIDKIKGDKDENDKSISGTATAKKIYEILNNDKEYSEKELNYLFSKLSTESYNITLDDISLLDNDIDVYKYYFGLSTSSKNSFLNIIEKTQINQKEYIDTMKFISETKEKYKNMENPYHGEKYTAYKTYLSKLKKNEIYEKINSLGISKYEKILLYKSAGYSINNHKEYLFNYINNLNITKAEKDDLWEYFFEIGG